MSSPRDMSRRCILGVFAHPDDEAAGAGGTFARYAAEGVQVYVAAATRGELGSLGSGEQAVERADLPAVREAELRSALRMLGVNPPELLGYRDQQVASADFAQLVGKVKALMDRLSPDVVITFGPNGVTGHADHIAIHRATVEAFDQYRGGTAPEPKLMFVAIPEDIAREFDLEVQGPEAEPTVFVDIGEQIQLKVRALRLHRSQQDIQELADLMEERMIGVETFHQAYPPAPEGSVSSGFWD